MNELLKFDTMITPKIICIAYYLLLLGVVIGGIAAIFGGQFLIGIGTIVGGSLFVRVYCELIIIFFKMNEALQELRKK
ncbi:MAG: DUF4282 domain-containing protein [Azoarcus sp.]|nr:DUF4282 domain-containing protein [Azoarcus sp.]